MTTIAKNKNMIKNMIKLVKFLVMIVLIVGIGMIDPIGNITPMGMKILGVFVGTLFGWMFIDFIIPSLVGLVFLGLSGYNTVMGIFQAALSDSIVTSMFITFAFMALLNEVNLTGALANWLLSRKFTQGHPWRIVAFLYFSAWIMGCLAGTLAAILIMWSIVYKIADEVGYERRSKDAGYLIAGIIFFAAMGAYVFPFYPTVLAFSSGYVAVMGEIPQMPWYFGFLVTNAFFFVFYLLLGKLIRFDSSKLKIDLSAYASGVKWNKKQLFGLGSLVFFILFMALPSFLPKTQFVTAWANMGIIGATVIVVAIAYLVSFDGEPLVENPAKLWVDGVSWDLLIMIAATMPIGAAIRSEEGGIMPTVLDWLESSIGGMNWIAFTIICMLVLGILTQVSHNLIIAAVLFPVFAPICADMGGDPLLWFICNFMAINAAFTTPAASGWGAMLHSNREWISVKEAYGFGFSTLVVTWLSCLVLIPLWTMVF